MIRLQQTVILIVALVIAAVMVGLGLWQMQVFTDQGDADARQRAAQPARPLDEVATPGESNTDGYGRTVTFRGRYDAREQFLIPVSQRPGHYRVLTALVRRDGTVVPVVRGEFTSDDPPPPPPGEVDQQGLYLASEPDAGGALPEGQLGSVRLSQVAQTWTRPMVPGFVTLDEADATAQGLTRADVSLPGGQGHARNGGYALQWWIFAGFGLVMAAKMARELGRRPDDAALDDAPAETSEPA